MQNNKLVSIEGLSTLAKLRKLDLSFNQIRKLEGISNLLLLEFLELGKNQIADVEALVSPNNRLVFLTELYLYMNNIKSMPRGLSFPQLRLLNLNRNQDLKSLSIGYCPLLETLNASYCSLTELGSLQLCPSMKELDVSFNQLPNLPAVLCVLRWNDTR
jgi:internalin A